MTTPRSDQTQCVFFQSHPCPADSTPAICPNCHRQTISCPKCHTKNRPIARFCRACGHAIPSLGLWAMMSGNACRTSTCDASSLSASSSETPWEYERSTLAYPPREIRHFSPQPVWTDEVLVVHSHDRHQRQEPHLSLLEPHSGRLFASIPHAWKNELSFSLTSNGVDLWARNDHQLLHYSLLHDLSFCSQTALPPQPAPHAAPIWFSPSPKDPHIGLLCILGQHAISCFRRNLSQTTSIPLAWNKKTDLSEYRSLCASWPYLFANSAKGDFLCVRFSDPDGSYEIIEQGTLPNPSASHNSLYSAPLYADGSFWIEWITPPHSSSTSSSPLSQEALGSGLIAFSPEHAPRTYHAQRTLRFEAADLHLSLRYPPLYNALNHRILLYTGHHPGRNTFFLFQPASQQFAPLQTSLDTLYRYKSISCGHQFWFAKDSHHLCALSLTTGHHHIHSVTHELTQKKIEGTPIIKARRVLIPMQDRYLSICTPEGSQHTKPSATQNFPS